MNEMKETMERVERDDFYENRGKREKNARIRVTNLDSVRAVARMVEYALEKTSPKHSVRLKPRS